jgi:hypothetical protein
MDGVNLVRYGEYFLQDLVLDLWKLDQRCLVTYSSGKLTWREVQEMSLVGTWKFPSSLAGMSK